MAISCIGGLFVSQITPILWILMIVLIVGGALINDKVSIRTTTENDAKIIINDYPIKNPQVYRNVYSLTTLIKQAKVQKKVITLSNLAPFTFKQIGEEKSSDDPQTIKLDFAKGHALFSSSISIVVACDPKVLIQSEEVVDDKDVINFAPVEYELSNCASMMYSDDTILVVDSNGGMYTRFKNYNQWVIEIN